MRVLLIYTYIIAQEQEKVKRFGASVLKLPLAFSLHLCYNVSMNKTNLTMLQATARAAELGYSVSAATLKEAAGRGHLEAQKVGEGRRGTWVTSERARRDYLEKRYRPRLAARKR